MPVKSGMDCLIMRSLSHESKNSVIAAWTKWTRWTKKFIQIAYAIKWVEMPSNRLLMRRHTLIYA